MNITPEEKRAIAALKKLAKTWPKSLWLFSASGSLCVMKNDEGGERQMRGDAVDTEACVTTIRIPNDGGDW